MITKQAWVPYFAVVGIGRDAAYHWMPLIGTLDILFGVLTFVQPRAALLVWMTAWALWTASLRPLAGEPFWEALERAGNYGVPFVLLLLSEAGSGWRSWVAPLRTRMLSPTLIRRLQIALTATTVLLLIGHGALALLTKRDLVTHAALLGLPIDAEFVTRIFGSIEIGLAALLILRPAIGVCLIILAWRLGTESLFLFAIYIVLNTNLLPFGNFDPFPYGLLTMVVSLEAIILSTLLLYSQNRQAARDRVRADIEYDVNLKAELQIQHLHEKIDEIHSQILGRLDQIEPKRNKHVGLPHDVTG